MADTAAPPQGFEDFAASLGSAPSAEASPTAAPEGFDDFSKDLAVQQHQEGLQAKYGSGMEQVKAGLEGAARGVLGSGITTGIEVASGAKPEDIRGREEANPITSGVAEAGTFLGSALLGTGEAGMLAKAGDAVQAASGIQQGGRLASIGSGALRGALETSLYQADKELHRKFVEDPAQTTDNLAINMGMATILGGVFGGATGALFHKAAAEQATKEAAPFVSGVDREAFDSGDLATNIEHSKEFTLDKRNTLLDAIRLGQKKENASQISKAAEDQGLKILPGMLSKDMAVAQAVDTLNKSPLTPSGRNVGKAWGEAWTQASNKLESSVAAEGVAPTAESLGDDMAASLSKHIEEAYAPQRQAFEQLTPYHDTIPVSDAAASLKSELEGSKLMKLGGNTEAGKLAKKIIDISENAKNAADLTQLKGLEELTDAGSKMNRDPMAYAKGIIRDAIQKVQDDSVSAYANSFPRNDEAGAVFRSLIEQGETARANYKPYISKIKELMGWLGKSEVGGTADALRFLNDKMTGTELSGKLSRAANDPAFLRFLQKEFPEQFQVMKNFKRGEIFKRSLDTDDSFNPKTFLRALNGVGKTKGVAPEVQKLVYSPEELKTASDIHTYLHDAFPENFNPSGTSHGDAFKTAASGPIAYLKTVGRDAFLEKLVNTSEGKQVQQLSQALIKGEKTMRSAVKSVFDTAKKMPEGVIPLAAHRAKLERLAGEAAKDPSKMIAMNDNNQAMPELNAPIAATAGRVVSYLASIKPNTTPASPLDTKRIVNSKEKSEYERALDIAQQPLVVLNSIKDGRITPKDIQSLQAMYPNLYGQLRASLVSGMTTAKDKGINIPYKTRMGLSMFLAQPLDSTMTPMGILNAQPKNPEQRQPAQAGKPPSASSMKGLNKLPGSYQTSGQAREQRSLKN